VYGFREKPTLDELKRMAVGPEAESRLEDCEVTVNMGVYIFSKKAMKDLVNVIECVDDGNSIDFGKHIIPMALGQGFSVHAHPHEGYWQPVRNLNEWYHANMGLCAPRTSLGGGLGRAANSAASLIDPEYPIFTVPRCLPPAAFRGATYSSGSIVSEGVVVGEGCTIVDSIVGPCVVLGARCDLKETIVIGHPEFAYLHGDSVPDVGAGCVLKNVVVDADVLIGEGCVLTNAGGVQESEVVDANGHGYIIKSGIITLLRGTQLAPGTII
jgi:glucose-1-phosphate adenylyltransferase